MTALNPLAVGNAALLRALDTPPQGGWTSIAALARHLERDKSNLTKTLAKLEEAGLLWRAGEGHDLTLLPEGAAQLDMITRAEAAQGDEPGSSGDRLTHAQISPDPDNARRDWDSAEAQADLAALAANINDRDLLQNLIVREDVAEAGHYILIGGERRWRAIGLLIESGDWTPDRPIRVTIHNGNELEIRLAALSENLQRRDLNPIEKGAAFESLAQLGLSNGDMAARFGYTPEYYQQYRRLLRLDQANQDRMLLPKGDPRHLSRRDALALVANKRDAEEEAEAEGQGAEAELDAADPLIPAARLLLAEIVHRNRAEANYFYADIPVGAEALTDTALVELSGAWLIDAPRIAQHGTHAGHVVIKITHNAALPFDWANSADEIVRDRFLLIEQERAARAAGIGGSVPVETYFTKWLNAPHALTAEGETIRAKADAAAEQARLTREANAKADEDAAARHRAAHLRQLTLLSPTQVPAPEALAATTLSVTADLGYALPLRVVNRRVIDAEDRIVATLGHWDDDPHSCAMATMVALSINTAANLPTAPQPEPEEA